MTRQVLFIVTAGLALMAFNLHIIEYFFTLLGPTAADRAAAGSFSVSLVYIHLTLWATISAAALYLLCIFFTHRVAGPAHSLAQSLRVLANGNLGWRVRLRKRDHLQEIAQELNATARRLCAWQRELEEATDELCKAARGGGDLEAPLDTLQRLVGRYGENRSDAERSLDTNKDSG